MSSSKAKKHIFFVIVALVLAQIMLSSCTQQVMGPDLEANANKLVDLEKNNESIRGGYTLRLVRDVISDCEVWIQTHPRTDVENVEWSGNCQNGLATGKGKVSVKYRGINPESIDYSGSFNAGLINGIGSVKTIGHSARGDVYITKYTGSWLDGHRHGEGHHSYHATEVSGKIWSRAWTGHFEQNELWGKGERVYNTVSTDGKKKTVTQKGEWQDHFLHGHGTEVIEIEAQSGEISKVEYTGDWVAGSKEGFGTEKSFGIEILNSQYEGSFQYHRPNGVGTIFYSNGDSFKGEWVGGSPVRGYCDFKTVGYSGKCKQYKYKTSKYSGMSCLGSKKGLKNCIPGYQRYWVQ